MKNVDIKKDKICACLIGGAIGDALGYQIEFNRDILEHEYTRYPDNEGLISDDTQMTLFTANALIWRETRGYLKGIAPSYVDALYLGYKDWYDTQWPNRDEHTSICWLKNVRGLNERRAPGTTCLSALAGKKVGTIEKPINNSKGCGAVMRVAPIGLYLNDPIEVGKTAALSSALTHGHPLGIIPSYVLATIIYYLAQENYELEEAIDSALKQYQENYTDCDKEINQDFLDLIGKALILAETNISDLEAIQKLGEGWVAEETLAIALYSCLKHKDSFKEAIICAVNHAGDSDSTGAITGNIMGAYLGMESIPHYYIAHLELKDVIMEIANDLAKPLNDEIVRNEEWVNKYVLVDEK